MSPVLGACVDKFTSSVSTFSWGRLFVPISTNGAFSVVVTTTRFRPRGEIFRRLLNLLGFGLDTNRLLVSVSWILFVPCSRVSWGGMSPVGGIVGAENEVSLIEKVSGAWLDTRLDFTVGANGAKNGREVDPEPNGSGEGEPVKTIGLMVEGEAKKASKNGSFVVVSVAPLF